MRFSTLLRRINNESTTAIEHAGQVGGGLWPYLTMASRCGYPEGPSPPRLLAATAYADIFEWQFHLSVISCQSLPAFRTGDVITGMNLNCKKCCGCSMEITREAPNGWTATNCPEIRDMKTAKFAKHIGSKIGPEDHLHWWTAPRHKLVSVCSKIGSSPKSLVERQVDYKKYTLPVLGFVGSLAAPDETALKEESRAL